ELTEQNLQQELQLSQNVLVVVSFWADWSDASKQVTSDLEQIAGQMGGQFQLAKASTDTAKQVAAAFRVQSVPAVFALLGGR
ncbi:thioredoxin family protein, partial [Streptococcus agalactiae]